MYLMAFRAPEGLLVGCAIASAPAELANQNFKFFKVILDRR
jgi:hypothetical protein